MEAESVYQEWLALLYQETDTGAADTISNLVTETIKQAASQAREQALKEVYTLIRSTQGDLRVDSAKELRAGRQALGTALNRIAALTTPEAQAQVQRRIVAGWLEERAEADKFSDDGIAAYRLLAALKEQE